MKQITIGPEDLRSPWDSAPPLFRIDEAISCDGTICGTVIIDPETGETVSQAGPHSHLVVSGYNPLASPRYTPISRLSKT
jgi:hypothetical protein